MSSQSFDAIVSLAKRRGFIFPGSEIYGGLANTYDYGPLGTELLRNIKNLWWNTFIHGRIDMVGLDSSIISSHRIWDASGHTNGFSDALVDCKKCKQRIRADHLIEDWLDTNADKISYKKTEHITEDEFKKAISFLSLSITTAIKCAPIRAEKTIYFLSAGISIFCNISTTSDKDD
jgi:glycyl-tRNA synthetase